MTCPLKLLNIEDDPADFLLLQRRLQQQGLVAECTRIASEAELIDALGREQWDLVISDYILPGENFLDLLLLLKSCVPDTPVILVSGSMGEEAAVDLLKAGIWDFVLKDKPLRLVPAIQRSLREAADRKALREAEAEARSLSASMRQSTQPMLLTDAQTYITYSNPAFNQLFGYREGQLLGKTVACLCPPDPANWAQQADLLKRLAEVGSGSGEFLRLAGDGSSIPVYLNLGAIHGDDGQLEGLVANYTDLRPLREKERALRESEEKYRRLVEGLKGEYFFYQHGAEGQFSYMSASFFDVLGFAPDEFQSSYRELLTDAPLNREAIHKMERSMRGEQQPLYEVEVWHKDGSRRQLEVLESPLLDVDGRVLAVDGFAHDITRRKAAERELRLRGAALEAAANAISITDGEGGVQWANPAYCALTGYAFDEIVGRNPRDLERSGKQTAGFYAEMWQSIKAGKVWQGELINRRKDGRQYCKEMTIAPVIDEDRSIRHFVSVGNDISERKATEGELARHREHLEELVAERTDELNVARLEALRLARAKSEFLANMSHEIRTPLNAVLGFAQVGRRESANRKAQTYFSQILNSGELLLGIINDILDFSKIEAGKLALERIPLDLRHAIERAAALVEPHARDKGLAWRVDCAADLPAGCLGDALRLTQILINLLSNAVKFTERGGVTLSVRRENENLLFVVFDTGIGLDADQQQRLFAAFEQADTTTTRRFGGTGLGLAISRRLAQLMGGEIRIDSVPGKGSVFTLCLPYVAAAAPARVTPSPTASEPRLAGLAILVAEDNEVNRLVLAELLAQDLPRLEFVGNGRLAVERMIAEPDVFDLVLMDIQMPEMDGYEATKRILAQVPGVPIIGLTAHALAEEREKMFAAGMVEHVTKPVQYEELRACILRHISAQRQTGAAPACSVPTPAAVPLAVPGYRDDAAALRIDWEALNARHARHPEFIGKLLHLALKSNADTCAQLRAAVHAIDLPRIAFLAHSVKGLAANLYAESLHELAMLAERAARAGDSDAAEQALALLVGVEHLMTAILDRLAEMKPHSAD